MCLVFLSGCPGDSLTELEQQLMEENEALTMQAAACNEDLTAQVTACKASAQDQLDDIKRQSIALLDEVYRQSGALRIQTWNAVICGAGETCAETDCSTLTGDYGSICNNFKQYTQQCLSQVEGCE